MLRHEQESLERLSRDRERIARGAVDTRAAELKADFERQISTIYAFDQNAIWKKAHDRAKAVIAEANRAIAVECGKLGIPPEFAPSLNHCWLPRGENSVNSRRAELRKAAYAEIDALAKGAKSTIALKASEVRVRLVEGSLESDDAKQFLAAMPTATDLMPRLSLPEVEKKLSEARGNYSNLLQ